MTKSVSLEKQLKLIKKYNYISLHKIRKNSITVTGRSIKFYKDYLFPDFKTQKNLLKYIKNKNYLDIGCGLNPIYNKSLLYKTNSFLNSIC